MLLAQKKILAACKIGACGILIRSLFNEAVSRWEEISLFSHGSMQTWGQKESCGNNRVVALALIRRFEDTLRSMVRFFSLAQAGRQEQQMWCSCPLSAHENSCTFQQKFLLSSFGLVSRSPTSCQNSEPHQAEDFCLLERIALPRHTTLACSLHCQNTTHRHWAAHHCSQLVYRNPVHSRDGRAKRFQFWLKVSQRSCRVYWLVNIYEFYFKIFFCTRIRKLWSRAVVGDA